MREEKRPKFNFFKLMEKKLLFNVFVCFVGHFFVALFNANVFCLFCFSDQISFRKSLVLMMMTTLNRLEQDSKFFCRDFGRTKITLSCVFNASLSMKIGEEFLIRSRRQKCYLFFSKTFDSFFLHLFGCSREYDDATVDVALRTLFSAEMLREKKGKGEKQPCTHTHTKASSYKIWSIRGVRERGDDI